MSSVQSRPPAPESEFQTKDQLFGGTREARLSLGEQVSGVILWKVQCAEFGDPERFKTLGELVAEIYLTIHRYNTLHIHSALRMAQRQFAERHAHATL